MPILIAHRGNLQGPNKWENRPEYVMDAIHQGYFAEVDVWKVEDTFYLGHDKPEWVVDFEWLLQPELILHIKNERALKLLSQTNVHYFWHHLDHYTITSHGWLWANILTPVIPDSIYNTRYDFITESIFYGVKGICCDHIKKIENT